jgi:WD40 repeat protein
MKVKCVDWHETDKKIVSCSRDKNIWVWEFNPTTYEYECENILEGHTNDVKCVKWIDYSTLVSASYDDTIRVWAENDDDFEEFQVIKTHSSIVWSIEYKNGILISCSSDLSVGLFKRDEDSLKFEKIQTIQNLHEEPIYGVFVLYPYFLTVIFA